MGEQTGKVLWARASLWKSAIVIAPLAVTALFLASGTQAQTSGSEAPSATTSANGPVAPIETAAAARRKGPKIKVKEATNDRVANPPATTDAATPTQTGVPVAPIDAPEAARSKGPKIRDKVPMLRVENPNPVTEPVAPIDAPDAARRGGPKGGGRDKELVGITATPAVDVAPAEGRRKEGPKGDSGSGRTAAPATDTQPAARRKEGPKGAGSSDAQGRTEATPAPDAQPAGRRKGPKGDVGHGRTSTTPLIIGALSAAAVLALVVSSGNDRPASP
jgi:hypothetical protein